MLDSDYLPLWCALNRLIANYWAEVDENGGEQAIPCNARADSLRAAPITSKLSPRGARSRLRIIRRQRTSAMTILLALLLFAIGSLFGAIVMACFAAAATGTMMNTTHTWPPLGTSADRENNAPPEQAETRRENPTGLRLAARSGAVNRARIP
jgi:hypothetical protein